jgi:hypothetical protein
LGSLDLHADLRRAVRVVRAASSRKLIALLDSGWPGSRRGARAPLSLGRRVPASAPQGGAAPVPACSSQGGESSFTCPSWAKGTPMAAGSSLGLEPVLEPGMGHNCGAGPCSLRRARHQRRGRRGRFAWWRALKSEGSLTWPSNCKSRKSTCRIFVVLLARIKPSHLSSG